MLIFLTNRKLRYKVTSENPENLSRNERTTSSLKHESVLTVNSNLEAVAIALTKLDVVGVKLQVIEVTKLEFCIHFKKNLMKSKSFFEQKHSQQLTPATTAGYLAVFGGNFKPHIKQLPKGKQWSTDMPIFVLDLEQFLVLNL